MKYRIKEVIHVGFDITIRNWNANYWIYLFQEVAIFCSAKKYAVDNYYILAGIQ